ncbi:ABC transporter permease [Micromonospora sp. NBC_01813]|uniref:ABC transporter permease n=1 Tax=Micromonospora sp. NBC_01813 TaxID=2975988 RepID=UPI002DD9F3C5|nr:ABC transporter permease [Micromonospora sp. NBC_01813]WSA08579.1 ABC transporter permease [Micromonospora sp. NBC_01813]
MNTLWWRLILVELRKMVDTRAGAWLLGVIGLSTAAIVTVVVIFVESAEQTFGTFFVMAVLPVAFLLPVLGVLLVTTEWSQRTALTTFALVPVRHRVLAAKLIAAVVASVASVVTSLAAAAAGTAIAAAAGTGASTDRWRIEAALIGYAVLFQVINVVMGVAFGMLLLNTPVAIVLLLLLPTVWTVLGSLIERLRDVAQWLDLTLTTEPLLTADVTAGQWARLATSVAVWVLVPLIAGMLRIQRRDIA